MPDFEFQEWERLSPEVTDGETQLRARVCLVSARCDCWFRQCGHFWFARPTNQENAEWNFVLLPSIRINSWGDTELCPLRSAEELKATLFNDTPPFFRVWEIADLKQFALWNGEMGWLFFGCEHDVLFFENHLPFRLDTPQHVARMPSSALFALLQNQWKIPDSELRFTSHFAALTELERRLHGVETRIGTPFEFVQMIRSALRAFVPRWPDDTANVGLSFGANGGGLRFTLEGDRKFGVRERAILGHILRAFEPRQLADSPDLPLCVRTLTEGGWSRSFSIEVARPSMHERLEGMLELRNWLETYWPDGVKHLGKVI